MNIEYIYLPPDQCSTHQIDQFVELIRRGAQVQLAGLRERIIDAFLLGFVYHRNRLVSTGALKNPTDNHRLEIFRKAQIPNQAVNYPRESGWAFTDGAYRGKGIHRQVPAQLLEMSPTSVYATTKADNVPRILQSVGFKESGYPYKNNRVEVLHLFTYDR